MSAFWRRLTGALAASLQWRLLALWTGLLLVPTALATIPLWRTLAALLGHSVHAPELARSLDLMALTDVGVQVAGRRDMLTGVAFLTFLATVLISPLATALTATATRASRPLGFVELWRGSLGDYGRMLRMLLVGLIPLFVVAFTLMICGGALKQVGEKATLESQMRSMGMAVALICLVVFVVAHASLEAGRAVLAVDLRERSGLRAWVRGIKLVTRHPLQVLALYLGVSLVSLLATSVLAALRARVVPVGFFGFWLALALAQLLVGAIGWGRAARLFALVALVRATQPPPLQPSERAPNGAVPQA
jgi:hypothetical protein